MENCYLRWRKRREGGYLVTSPMDPELVTEAETVAEAFEMARDAMKTMKEGRSKLIGGRTKFPRARRKVVSRR